MFQPISYLCRAKQNSTGYDIRVLSLRQAGGCDAGEAEADAITSCNQSQGQAVQEDGGRQCPSVRLQEAAMQG